MLAVCRSDLGGNVPLARLSHRASKSATARAKITARTYKCAGADDLPKSALPRKRPSASASQHVVMGHKPTKCTAVKIVTLFDLLVGTTRPVVAECNSLLSLIIRGIRFGASLRRKMSDRQLQAIPDRHEAKAEAQKSTSQS